jgi:hypothetical protein
MQSVTRIRPVATPAVALGPVLISFEPAALPATARPADPRHDRMDFALMSLQEDDMGSLMS